LHPSSPSARSLRGNLASSRPPYGYRQLLADPSVFACDTHPRVSTQPSFPNLASAAIVHYQQRHPNAHASALLRAGACRGRTPENQVRTRVPAGGVGCRTRLYGFLVRAGKFQPICQAWSHSCCACQSKGYAVDAANSAQLTPLRRILEVGAIGRRTRALVIESAPSRSSAAPNWSCTFVSKPRLVTHPDCGGSFQVLKGRPSLSRTHPSAHAALGLLDGALSSCDRRQMHRHPFARALALAVSRHAPLPWRISVVQSGPLWQ